MLPDESYQVLYIFNIDKVYLLQDIGLQLFLIAEICLIFCFCLANYYAITHDLMIHLIMSLRFLDISRFFIRIFESIGPEQEGIL